MSVSASFVDTTALGRVTLVISHADDLAANNVRMYLANLAELGLTRVVYWLVVDSALTSITSDFLVDALFRDGTARVQLFQVLSEAGGVEAVDVVGLTVEDLQDESLSALATTIPVVRKAFVKWLRDAPISDIRVCARAFGESLPDKKYFSAMSTSRVILMPLDPSHDYTVFRPVGKTENGSMVGHVAVELASLLGCWSVQQEIPSDALSSTSRGTDGTGINLVLSSVRSLAVPAPPVSEALGNSSQLPVPRSFTAVPKPERLSASLAEKIYPKDLVFVIRERPEGPSEFVKIDSFVPKFLKQFLIAIWSLPRVIRQGIQREMDELAISAVQDAIGGAASSLGLVSPRSVRRGTDDLDFDVLIEGMIEKSNADLAQNYRFGMPASEWRIMSRSVMGLADGEGEPTSRLLTDDTVITAVDVLVPACEATASAPEIVKGLLDLPADAPDKSVVECISQRFLKEIKVATGAVTAALQQLRGLPSAIRTRPEIKGDEVIRIAAVVGAALVVVSLGAFSPLRPLFAFEWLSAVIRDAAWAMPAALGALISIWVLIHIAMKSDRTRRVVDVVSSLVIPLVLLSVLVQFSDIRSWALRNGGGSNYRYAIFLFVACFVLALLAIRQAFKSPIPKHKVFGRAAVVIGSIYLVVAAVIGLAQNDPPIFNDLPDVRGEIFVVLFPSALISFAISVARIAIARVREIYRALLVGRLIEWGIGEVKAGRDAEIRLEVLRVQWAALGAVLTRMIRFPLGRDLTSAIEHDEVATGGSDPLKLDFARIDLTNRGRGGLEARLRQSVIRQGWLNQQFAEVFRSYSKTAAFDRGLTEEEISQIDPLSCTSTPTAEEAGDGLAHGDRWSFIEDLFEGSFEEVLRQPADQIRFDALYESVLVDPKSIEIVGAARVSLGAASFLSQSVSQGRLTVPVGFLNILVTGGDPRVDMKRLVWWPSSLVELSSDLRPDESEIRDSDLAKPWKEFGTRLAMSLQVSWSEPFAYEDFIAAQTARSVATPDSSDA